jgi:hypothetical protein
MLGLRILDVPVKQRFPCVYKILIVKSGLVAVRPVFSKAYDLGENVLVVKLSNYTDDRA